MTNVTNFVRTTAVPDERSCTILSFSTPIDTYQPPDVSKTLRLFLYWVQSKSHMKKHVLLLILLPILSACITLRKDNFKIGVSQCSEDVWREMANEELRREASFFGDIDLEIRSVADNSEDQIRDVQKVDLLVISPNESSALTPIVSKAYNSGIPVILFDRKIDSEDYTAYVGADNWQIGFQIGDYLKRTFPHGDPVRLFIVRGTKGSTADQERYDGLTSSLGTDPKWQILTELYGNFTQYEAYDQTMKWLEATPESEQGIDAVVAFNDRMANGVYSALSEGDYRGYFPAIFGVDAMRGPGGGIESILKGTMTASFIYPTGGEQIIDVARRILNHIAFDRINLLNTAAVDIYNARVMQLQYNQIDLQQQKLDRLNDQYRDVSVLYSNSRRAIWWFSALVALSLFFVWFLIQTNRRKSRLNQQLNESNAQVEKQVQELEDQKQQLERLNAEVEEATQAKLLFYTNVSHEFKTPLSLITGTLDELNASKPEDPQLRGALQILTRNSNKLLALINEILDFRTYESGKMTVNREPVDVKSFLEDLNLMFRNIIRQRRINFRFDCQDEVSKMMIDKNKLEKIYFNLVSNAFKHVKNNGTIHVGLKKNEGRMELAVFNTGSYIPQDKVKDIFERFYKMGTDNESTGIGLALTASLVSVLGGDIRVDSSPEIGTKFIVDLPFIPVEEENAVQIPATTDLSYSQRRIDNEIAPGFQDDILDDLEDTGKPAILVIEDNPDMLQFIKNLLSEDYRVLLAPNGERGVEKAVQYLPQLILCDIMMPGMDGYEVCKTIRSKPKTEHIPIILLTACSLDEQKAKGYESGADAYIQKPFNAQVLKIRIQKLLEKDETIRKAVGNDWLLDRHPDSTNESTAVVGKLKTFVEENIEKDISIEDITRHLGLSKATLYRKLREVTDYSPVDLVRLIRLRHAINLIQYEGKDISVAAFESGFNSASYFSRTFQKYYKVAPREWIKQNC